MSNRRSRGRAARADVVWASGGECHICGEVINTARERYEVEHIIPLALGGEDGGSNLRIVHIACHKEKTARDRAVIAKVKRVKAKHEGTSKPSRRQLTDPRYKRKVSGRVVLRDGASA